MYRTKQNTKRQAFHITNNPNNQIMTYLVDISKTIPEITMCTQCPICKNNCDPRSANGDDRTKYDCPVCGKFDITGSMEATILRSNLTFNKEKAQHWLQKKRTKYPNEIPCIGTYDYRDLTT